MHSKRIDAEEKKRKTESEREGHPVKGDGEFWAEQIF
jgi:hypothetical protein